MSRIADQAADAAAAAWERKMKIETADEMRAEADRAYMASRSHRYVESAEVRGFCKCGTSKRVHA